jgi:tetratricopeptide (TPR) repeat protein
LLISFLLAGVFRSFQEIERNIVNHRLLLAIIRGNTIPSDLGSAYLTAVMNYRQGRYAEALTSLKQATNPDPVLIRWFLARAQNGVGDWESALNTLDMQNPAEMRLYADILFNQMKNLTPQEQAEWEAKLIRHPDLILLYAAYLLAQSDFMGAEVWAKRVPDYGNNISAQMIVGKSYFYREGGRPKAEQIFRSIYEADPDGENAYWYGRTLAYNSQTEKAVQILLEAIQKATNNTIEAIYWVDLGTIYAHSERCTEAQTALENALQKDAGPRIVSRVEAARQAFPPICQSP